MARWGLDWPVEAPPTGSFHDLDVDGDSEGCGVRADGSVSCFARGPEWVPVEVNHFVSADLGDGMCRAGGWQRDVLGGRLLRTVRGAGSGLRHCRHRPDPCLRSDPQRGGACGDGPRRSARTCLQTGDGDEQPNVDLEHVLAGDDDALGTPARNGVASAGACLIEGCALQRHHLAAAPSEEGSGCSSRGSTPDVGVFHGLRGQGMG